MTKFLVLLIVLAPMASSANDAATWLRGADDQYRGTSPSMEITMEVKTKKFERTYSIRSTEYDRSTGLTRILAPKSERGTGFLKRDGKLWMYSPKVGKTIPIPGAMMGNSFMGSDFSYDDMSRESDILDDFDAEMLADEPCPPAPKSTCVHIKLSSKETATVPYDRLDVWIDKVTKVYHQQTFFDEDGEAVRVMTFTDVRPIGERLYAHKMFMQNLIEKDRTTSITVDKIEFGTKPNIREFSKAALKKFRP